MSECTKDLRVFLKFKNARLLDAIDNTFGPDISLSAVMKAIGTNANVFYGLINLSKSPFPKNKGIGKGSGRGSGHGVNVEGTYYNRSAVKIAEALGRLVEDLFPKSLYDLKLPKDISRDMNSVQLLSLQEAREMKLLTDESYEPDFDAPMLSEDLNKILGTLTTREELVLRLRFGLGGPELTFDQLAVYLKCSKERLRQIEKRALLRLRHPARSLGLKTYYDDDAFIPTAGEVAND
jgi:RNA polymerase primary sigma factor